MILLLVPAIHPLLLFSLNELIKPFPYALYLVVPDSLYPLLIADSHEVLKHPAYV